MEIVPLVRSVLYVPASNPRALEKAAGLAVDALIFDLEDAVIPAEKPAARVALVNLLGTKDYGSRLRLVRINGFDTEWGRADAVAFADHPGVDGILVPKVNAASDLDAVGQVAPEKRLWAMMETPMAMLNAAQIAAHGRLGGMVMGTNDLAKDLGARHRSDRLALASALGLSVLAARAYGRLVIDGVFNAIHDAEAFEAECEQGLDMGFDGKSLIHPDQVAAANRIFAPSPADLDLARRQIECFEAARAAGRGVAVLDGKIVENLHIVAARALIAKARAIADRQG